MLHLVIGNSGPTVAENVRVTFQPALPSSPARSEKVAGIERTLATGLRSLAPGRAIRWSLGAAFDIMPKDEAQLLSVRVEADGPAGALPVVEIEIDVNEWRESRDAPEGSLHHVRGAVKDLTKAVSKIDHTMRRAVDALSRPEDSDPDWFHQAPEFLRGRVPPPELERGGEGPEAPEVSRPGDG